MKLNRLKTDDANLVSNGTHFVSSFVLTMPVGIITESAILFCQCHIKLSVFLS